MAWAVYDHMTQRFMPESYLFRGGADRSARRRNQKVGKMRYTAMKRPKTPKTNPKKPKKR